MTTHDLAIPPLVPPGTVLGGRFEVGEILGTGGSATVFAGRDTRLGRPVAVKVLRPDLAADASAQAAFQVEATAAAMLSHPGIVTVHDVGSDELDNRTIAWIAMERIRGRTVRTLLSSGAVPPLDPVDALELTAHVLGALEHAHLRGVVHRDISPGNVMITDDGAVKVLDFGIAAVGEQSGESEVVHGSVSYVSPEQAQGLRVDRRSDLYSVGCLLFALVTGGPPYVADEVRDVALMHVTAVVPLASSRLPGVPAVLDALLVRTLAKRPADRPATAGELRAEVLRVAGELRAAGPDHSTTQVIPRVSTTTTFAPVRRPAGPASVPVPMARELAERRRQEPARIVQAQPLVAPRPPEPPERRSVLWPVTLLVMTLAGLVALLLWLFAGPEQPAAASVTVPDVAGQTAEAAQQALGTAGLRDGSVRTEPHDTVAAGLVVRTDPAAGESVPEESTVLIVVSGGPQARPSVAVPQLDGATLAEARTLLDGAGLTLGELLREDSARPADTVLASDPAAGAPLEPGAVVTLTLASGNQVVPDVTGLGIGDARARVQDAGFTVEESPSEAPDAEPGAVLGVQPVAGTSLRLGSTVTLVVAVGPPPTEEPDPSPTASATPIPTETPSPTPTGPSIGPPTDTPTDNTGGEQP